MSSQWPKSKSKGDLTAGVGSYGADVGVFRGGEEENCGGPASSWEGCCARGARASWPACWWNSRGIQRVTDFIVI